MTEPSDSATDPASGAAGVRFARMLASPLGVLITIPALVVAVGIGILLVGRDATRSASDQMARRLLTTNATSVSSDVVFALDQAGPVLERLRTLADPGRPRDEILIRLHDLVIGRPGVAYASISFPDGTFRGAYLDGARVAVQESKLGPGGTERQRFTVDGGALVPLRRETDDYDPRKRGFYQLAEARRARAWTEPYTFFQSHETGITCTEPVFDERSETSGGGAPAGSAGGAGGKAPRGVERSETSGGGAPAGSAGGAGGKGPRGVEDTRDEADAGSGAGHRLRAVLTVDFDVGALSQYVARPALDQARSIVYTRDGTVLAYPAADKLALPAGDKLLRHDDLRDPALEALLAASQPSELRLSELDASDGSYLAAVAPIGGRRAGVAVPLDWYVATVVPIRTLLGPTHALERSSVIASAGALAIAVGLALVLAWNLVRMRRQVARSRAEARTAEARARELGSYRLVARLGAGGMGEVWRAEHRLLARTAAIKLIRPEALHDPQAVDEIHERFRREAQTLASMRSRHTIAIFDYGVTELGVFYYVMELLDGLDLESLVAQFGPQPAARVIPLLIQACASLAEAHDAGLLHRDIKPPNLFISRAADEVDIVKLLDFGIVQTANEDPAPRIRPEPARPGAAPAIDGTPRLTQIGAMLGTPGFMAPEQILGMQLDGRADLYALGCCAWWLLTGREVFAREPAEAKILHKHIYEPVPRLRDHMPDQVSGHVSGHVSDQTRDQVSDPLTSWCPPALEAVITACLAKDIADRPRDARDLAAMLRAIEIPPDVAWTPERAGDWWRAYQPVAAPSAAPASEVQVIMPGRTDQRPVAATSETAIAQTIASSRLPG